jgi:hypothetical protein
MARSKNSRRYYVNDFVDTELLEKFLLRKDIPLKDFLASLTEKERSWFEAVLALTDNEEIEEKN